MDVLVTGATGFLGRVLVDMLLDKTDANLRLAVRHNSLKPRVQAHPRVSISAIDSIDRHTDWGRELNQCDYVIHTAARVHIMGSLAKETGLYDEVNLEGTLNLARQAAKSGVKRFIFLSSIKVNGEEHEPGLAYRPDDEANPQDAYAWSKYQAELGLLELSKQSDLEIVIIRPPLIYGPEVKGNFREMIAWLKKGVPLPLANVSNERSLVSVYNLSSLILCVLTHPEAANQIFLVSDGQTLSTSELLRRVGQSLDKKPRLVRLPVSLMKEGLKYLGKEQLARRLFGSLVLDIKKTKDMLGWEPEHHMDVVLKEIISED